MSEWHREGFVITTDRARMDVDAIHAFLTRSYWAKGRSRETVARSVEHSLCFGLLEGRSQIGFARVLTDYAVLAYLMDVYVLESHRGKGLGAWLVGTAVSAPELRGLKWMLATLDARKLYERFGFGPVDRPERLMQRAPG